MTVGNFSDISQRECGKKISLPIKHLAPIGEWGIEMTCGIFQTSYKIQQG